MTAAENQGCDLISALLTNLTFTEKTEVTIRDTDEFSLAYTCV